MLRIVNAAGMESTISRCRRIEKAEILRAVHAVIAELIDRRMVAPVLVFKASIATAWDIVVAGVFAGLAALTAINDARPLKETRASGQERRRQFVRAVFGVAGDVVVRAATAKAAIGAERETIVFRALDRGIGRHAIDIERHNDDAARCRIKGAASDILAIGADGNPLVNQT
jgi:hypothetical protein